jgi:SRF-type transcription factor (DNA-binding and dimerisation domain)
MELIASRSIHKVTFKGRKSSLFKKARELATLPTDQTTCHLKCGPSVEGMMDMVSCANDRLDKENTKKMARRVANLSDLPQDTEKFFNGLPTEIAYSNECILELELKSLH